VHSLTLLPHQLPTIIPPTGRLEYGVARGTLPAQANKYGSSAYRSHAGGWVHLIFSLAFPARALADPSLCSLCGRKEVSLATLCLAAPNNQALEQAADRMSVGLAPQHPARGVAGAALGGGAQRRPRAQRGSLARAALLPGCHTIRVCTPWGAPPRRPLVPRPGCQASGGAPVRKHLPLVSKRRGAGAILCTKTWRCQSARSVHLEQQTVVKLGVMEPHRGQHLQKRRMYGAGVSLSTAAGRPVVVLCFSGRGGVGCRW